MSSVKDGTIGLDAAETSESHAEIADKASPSPDEDAKVTFKTKLAVATLILMYESYLFTQLM